MPRNEGTYMARRYFEERMEKLPNHGKPHIRVLGYEGWRRVQLWAPTGRQGYALTLESMPRVRKNEVMRVASAMQKVYEERKRA